MHRLNIARQLMLGKLVVIRNTVEHQDADPPERGQSRELVELVLWYFLKSTDTLVRCPLQRIGVVFVPDDHFEGDLTISCDFATWLPEVLGLIPGKHVSLAPVPDWAEVRLGGIEGCEEDLITIHGQVCGPAQVLWSIWRDYFARAANVPRATLRAGE